MRSSRTALSINGHRLGEVSREVRVDSAQQGEVPYDRVLDGFTIIAHEPYYKNYTQQDLVKLFTDAGFEVDTSEVHWVSKCMVVSKPLEQAAPVAEQEAEAVTPELA